MAAFAISLPDRSRCGSRSQCRRSLLGSPPIGYGCFVDWVSIGPAGIRFSEELRCFVLLVLTSVPLAIALVAVLCYAAMLRGGAVAIMAVLRSPPLRRPHCRCATDHDATVMILIWNLGTAALITAAGSLFGLRMFRWP